MSTKNSKKLKSKSYIKYVTYNLVRLNLSSLNSPKPLEKMAGGLDPDKLNFPSSLISN